MQGPTGSRWALERSDERHAQQGAPSRELLGTDPICGTHPLELLFNIARDFKFFSVRPYDVLEIAAGRWFGSVV